MDATARLGGGARAGGQGSPTRRDDRRPRHRRRARGADDRRRSASPSAGPRPRPEPTGPLPRVAAGAGRTTGTGRGAAGRIGVRRLAMPSRTARDRDLRAQIRGIAAPPDRGGSNHGATARRCQGSAEDPPHTVRRQAERPVAQVSVDTVGDPPRPPRRAADRRDARPARKPPKAVLSRRETTGSGAAGRAPVQSSAPGALPWPRGRGAPRRPLSDRPADPIASAAAPLRQASAHHAAETGRPGDDPRRPCTAAAARPGPPPSGWVGGGGGGPGRAAPEAQTP